MDYKKSYTLLWVGLIAGFVLMLIGVFLEIGWLLWPGAVVVMADVLQTLLFFRCPLIPDPVFNLMERTYFF